LIQSAHAQRQTHTQYTKQHTQTLHNIPCYAPTWWS